VGRGRDTEAMTAHIKENGARFYLTPLLRKIPIGRTARRLPRENISSINKK
jgi:hypothetical protein